MELKIKDRSYSATMFLIIKYKRVKEKTKKRIKKTRSFGTLNKFRNGVKIMRINPAILLIKNLG
jgi:hypothetical protein